MIIIINDHKTTVTSFASYWEVFHHIEHLEKPKRAQGSQILLPAWSFTVHPYQRALHLHRYMDETLKTGIGAKDDRRGFNVLERCCGNVAEASLLPLTPDLNIEDLRAEWCSEYLRARGYFNLKPDDLSSFMKPW